jgi:ABC-type transporter Mla subunit MlaD
MNTTQKQTTADLIADGSLGVFTVTAIVLLVLGALWLRDNIHMHQPRYINVYFHDIAQLSDSANVFIDGVRVGTVDELHWKSEHRVLVKLRITNHHVKLPVGSRFDILNNGIVGAKYVEIMVPEHKAGEPDTPELASDCTVEGEDPVRPELALNNLVVGLSRIDTEKLGRNFDADRARICRAADQLALLANKSMPLVDGALPLEHDLHQLEHETTKVAHRLNTFMDNPNMSTDMKQAMHDTKETVASVKDTMHELNLTLKDKDLRGDLVAALNALHSSTQELERTVTIVQKITADKSLRDDVKDILRRADESLTKVDQMFKSPTYGTDLKQTLTTTRAAIGHIDLAARQLNQILDQRSPLMHLLIGRPGYIKDDKQTKPARHSKESKESKQTKQSTQIKRLQSETQSTGEAAGSESQTGEKITSP